MTPKLREYLYNLYGGFADKRYKKTEYDMPIKLDDQSEHDITDAFCGVFVSVPTERLLQLRLTNNAPVTEEIRNLVESYGGSIYENNRNSNIEIGIDPSNYLFIDNLAKTIDNAISSGRKYHNPNWKWLCPRTAKTLSKLSKAIQKFNSR